MLWSPDKKKHTHSVHKNGAWGYVLLFRWNFKNPMELRGDNEHQQKSAETSSTSVFGHDMAWGTVHLSEESVQMPQNAVALVFHVAFHFVRISFVFASFPEPIPGRFSTKLAGFWICSRFVLGRALDQSTDWKTVFFFSLIVIWNGPSRALSWPNTFFYNLSK